VKKDKRTGREEGEGEGEGEEEGEGEGEGEGERKSKQVGRQGKKLKKNVCFGLAWFYWDRVSLCVALVMLKFTL
jgi:hypothetical protein